VDAIELFPQWLQPAADTADASAVTNINTNTNTNANKINTNANTNTNTTNNTNTEQYAAIADEERLDIPTGTDTDTGTGTDAVTDTITATDKATATATGTGTGTADATRPALCVGVVEVEACISGTFYTNYPQVAFLGDVDPPLRSLGWGQAWALLCQPFRRLRPQQWGEPSLGDFDQVGVM
jgi:hypothetical protein